MIHTAPMIKVCGMRNPDNIDQLIKLDPDMIGLIFYPKSPRFVDNPESLRGSLSRPRSYKLTGVFVNPELDDILQIHRFINLDYVQLHGDEDPEFLKRIKAYDFKIIKAFRISETYDLLATRNYDDLADLFLFDTKTDKMGGSGEKFDWAILDHYTGKTRFLLSGGISQNDHPVINHESFAGLDVNSRFEIEPGIKDILQLKDFILRIRNDKK